MDEGCKNAKWVWVWRVCSVGIIFSMLACAQNQVQPDRDTQMAVSTPPAAVTQDNKTTVLMTNPGSPLDASKPAKEKTQNLPVEYTLGIEDSIQIDLIKPESLTTLAVVAPDGIITFPYIGNVMVKGRTIAQVQEEIQTRLANGYMKYPVVAVSLKESRSRKFFVYGEVLKPGSYPIEENMTTLRAISMAGGFTRFGSSSRVKVLRPKTTGSGYNTIKVNIKAVMEGDSNEDLLLTQGDIVVVSEGVF